VNALIVIEIRN